MKSFLILFVLFMAQMAHAEITFRWMGVSGFIISDGKSTIVFDPAFTRVTLTDYLPLMKVQSNPEEVEYWSNKCQLKKIDAIFVNHSHSDHVIDAPALIKKFGGTLYGSQSTINYGVGQGLSYSQMHIITPNLKLKVGDFEIETYDTPHGKHFRDTILMDGDIEKPLKTPASAWDFHAGLNMSFKITHPEMTFLFQSPGKVPNPDVLKGIKTDVALMTIANRGTSDEPIKKRVVESGAKIVIPLHHDNFLKPMRRDGEMDLFWGIHSEEFDQKMKELAPKAKLIWPKYCEEIKLN